MQGKTGTNKDIVVSAGVHFQGVQEPGLGMIRVALAVTGHIAMWHSDDAGNAGGDAAAQ